MEKERNSSDRQERIPIGSVKPSAFRSVKSIGRVSRDRSIYDVDSLARRKKDRHRSGGASW